MKTAKKKKAPAKAKKTSSNKKIRMPTLKVSSIDDLPVVYEFLKWHFQQPNSQELAHFFSDPVAYLGSHNIAVAPKVSSKFNAQVKSSLKFLGKPLYTAKDFAKHKTVFGISQHTKAFPFKPAPAHPLRGPKKTPRVIVKHPQEKFTPIPIQQGYQTAVAPLVDARGSGNFDLVLQVGDSFYNQAISQLVDPPPTSNLRSFIFETANMHSWFLVYFRITLSFPTTGSITFASGSDDMVSLTGPIDATVLSSTDRKNWFPVMTVPTSTFLIEGPLRSAEEMSFRVGVGINKDIPLTNTMGGDFRNQSPTFTPGPGPAVPSHINILITQAIRDYFTQVRPWFPVIAQLPTLAHGLIPDPVDGVVPFGSSAVTIPAGGPEPLVSMQFGNPKEPFRQSILPSGSNMAVGVATHVLRFLIERNLPALPIAVDSSTSITETEIHFRDGFIEFILHGVKQTCACFFDLGFTLSQKVAFTQDSDGNVRVALLEEHLLSNSDRALLFAAFSFVFGLTGLIAAAVIDEVLVEALEEEANDAIRDQVNQNLDVIPQLFVLPLLPDPMPHFLRLKLEDVRIRPSGVFLSGNAMITALDPIVAVAFDSTDANNPFSGRKRFLEMPFAPESPMPPVRSFSMSLTRSEPFGLINLQAFTALEIRRPTQFQSATRIRITFINDFTGRRRRFRDKLFRGANFIRISGIENITINPTRVIFTYV